MVYDTGSASVVSPTSFTSLMSLPWRSTLGDLAQSFSFVDSMACAPQRAVPVPGDGRDDWKILRAASEVLGKTLPYDTLEVRLIGRFVLVPAERLLFGVRLVRGCWAGLLAWCKSSMS